MKKTDIDRKEVLSYLGLTGTEIPEEISEGLSYAAEEVMRVLKKTVVKKRFRIEREDSGIGLSGTGVLLPGEDVKRVLRHSDEILLFTVSIGSEIGSLVKEIGRKDPVRALLLDATASAAVTALLKEEERKEEEALLLRKRYLTVRFGAGYGDLPLSAQKGLAEALELKEHGISCDFQFFLTPEKTLTTFSGIINEPDLRKGETCGICRFSDICRKKEGAAFPYCMGRSEEKEEDVFAERNSSSLLTHLLRVAQTEERKPHCGKVFLHLAGRSETGLSGAVLSFLLKRNGVEVIEIPEERKGADIISFIKKETRPVLLLSVTMFTEFTELRDKIEKIKSEIPDCKIIAGGGMLTESDFKAWGGDLFLSDIREVTDMMKKTV